MQGLRTHLDHRGDLLKPKHCIYRGREVRTPPLYRYSNVLVASDLVGLPAPHMSPHPQWKNKSPWTPPRDTNFLAFQLKLDCLFLASTWRRYINKRQNSPWFCTKATAQHELFVVPIAQRRSAAGSSENRPSDPSFHQ
jgi:hypothetical protein